MADAGRRKLGWVDQTDQAGRPYVLLSCAVSLDGYLDDASSTRLVLSGPEDLDRVDELRASCDAILVGAGTIRADNPALLLRSQARRAARIARGLPPDPVKVTVTSTGALDPQARFFTADTRDGAETGSVRKIVYVASPALSRAQDQFGTLADVVEVGEPAALRRVLADLRVRGVERLMVEGGSSVLTQLLADGLADELQLAIAPFFVGDSRAPRFVGDGSFPWNAQHPATLVRAGRCGQDVVLVYALSSSYAPH